MMGDKKIIIEKIRMNCGGKIEQITLPHAIEIPEEWRVNEKTMMFYILKKLCEEFYIIKKLCEEGNISTDQL